MSRILKIVICFFLSAFLLGCGSHYQIIKKSNNRYTCNLKNNMLKQNLMYRRFISVKKINPDEYELAFVEQKVLPHLLHTYPNNARMQLLIFNQNGTMKLFELDADLIDQVASYSSAIFIIDDSLLEKIAFADHVYYNIETTGDEPLEGYIKGKALWHLQEYIATCTDEGSKKNLSK